MTKFIETVVISLAVVFIIGFTIYHLNAYNITIWDRYINLQVKQLKESFDYERRIGSLKRIIDFQEKEILKLKGIK